jgi:fido (protein-threonine AMPylation protein)
LNKFEAHAVFLAIDCLAVNPITGPFDTNRLQETHRRILGNVYPWAGELPKDIGMMTKTRPSGFVVA